MNLVIVESPSKSKTIEKYLGEGYKVVSSMGHIRDLPKSKLGVDTDKNFEELYEISVSKKKVVSELKRLAKEASKIYLATDPDREGEAISWHIAQVLEEPAKSKVFQRVVFHEITKDAVLEAFKNPRQIDINLVSAQRARRILDRLVGYKLSPLLWKKIRYGLSAGRVQSVAVRFVVEREGEIENFKSESYSEIIVVLKSESVINRPSSIHPSDISHPTSNFIEAKLTHIANKPIYVNKKYNLFSGEYTTSATTLSSKEQVSIIVSDLEKSSYNVSSIDRKEYQKSPKPPFTTSSLQQEASWRLGYSPKRTMSIAQKLYEYGLITYMRTDSTNLSSQAIDSIRNLISQKYGKEYLPDTAKFYKTKIKVAQEAHEAIRPTNVLSNLSSPVINKLKSEEQKLYEIIWQRVISCQMTSAIYDTVNIKINASKDSNSTQYVLQSKDSVLKFPGWMILYNAPKNGRNGQHLDSGKFKIGSILSFISLNVLDKQTPPPPYYNEASLIKELEKFGIGRPSTYAPIMSTIQDRGYVQKQEGKLKATDVGKVVTRLLNDSFKQIMDVNFTAGIEESLDGIANGEKERASVIKDFYVPFEKLLLEKTNNLKKSNYTTLKNLDEKCPKCGSNLIVKLGKYGKFISCGTYPKCDYLRNIIESTGIKCPKCKDGDVIVRRTKKGKIFYGCSNYPKCAFAVWKLEDIKKSEKMS